jgi:hypothetical protein
VSRTRAFSLRSQDRLLPTLALLLAIGCRTNDVPPAARAALGNAPYYELLSLDSADATGNPQAMRFTAISFLVARRLRIQ